MWVDRRGRVEEVPGPARGYVAPRLSPDGRRVAVHTIGMTGGVWVYDLTRSALTRLTPDGQLGGWPVWTPDGKRVVYRGTGRLFWRPADQSTRRRATDAGATRVGIIARRARGVVTGRTDLLLVLTLLQQQLL